MTGKEDLEKYFLQILPEILPEDECIGLLSLLAGDKPGVLLMSVDEQDEQVLERFCEDFDLEIRFKGERTDFLDPGAFIAEEEEQFSVLDESSGSFYGCSDEAVGNFLGYPRDAIEYYSETDEDLPGQINQEKVRELYKHGEITEEDVKLLELVDYVPRPERENIKTAVERGRRRKEKLEAFDREYDTRIAEIYLEKILGKEVSVED